MTASQRLCANGSNIGLCANGTNIGLCDTEPIIWLHDLVTGFYAEHQAVNCNQRGKGMEKRAERPFQVSCRELRYAQCR